MHPQEGEIPISLMLLIMRGPRYQHINSSIPFVHEKANPGYFMSALYLLILPTSCLSKPSAVPSGGMREIQKYPHPYSGGCVSVARSQYDSAVSQHYR